jgi:uracil-DNA glycosylase
MDKVELKEEEIPEIYKKIKNCPKKCPGVKHGKIWLKDGNTSKSVLFVGIQPNWKGHPDNPRGKSTEHFFNDFTELRREYGLDKYHFTNLVKCATPKPSKPPTYLVVNNCLPWLEREIKEFGTKLVVFVGKNNYEAYKDYIKEKFHIKTSWCYHYSGRAKAIPDYRKRQRNRMRVIKNLVNSLLV